jgi:hypothetical protein
MFKKIRNFFWALRKRKFRFVVDTCIFLNKDDLEKLQFLNKIYIPRAVQEQISRLASEINKEQEIAKKAEILISEKLSNGKWQIIGSTGTGLLQAIENKKISDLPQEMIKQLEKIYKKKKDVWDEKREKLKLEPLKFTPQLILKDLIGLNDLRILASCLNLKKINFDFYLITRDKTLSILANFFGINVIEKFDDL